jgi:hypothetical protein
LNNISKTSGNAATDGSRYMDFSCSDATLLKEGTQYTFYINVGNCSGSQYESFEIYIDYNNDGDFRIQMKRFMIMDRVVFVDSLQGALQHLLLCPKRILC